jgi:amino acid adenylation domain-containing protein
MAAMFARILDTAIAEPTTAIAALALLGARDRETILVDWNQTAHTVVGALTLHERFEMAVDRDPTARAVSFRHETLCYGELDARANQWAHLFLRHGIKTGDTIGFWGDRCLESIEILLGILKAGAAFVPMAASWPAARVTHVATTLGMALIVTQRRFQSLLDGVDCPSLRYRLTTDLLAEIAPNARPPVMRPSIVVDPDATAYVIFTSGSTGRPKGVVVRHSRAVNLIDWVNRTFDVTAADRLLFVTSYCFDLAVYDIFGLLAAGGSLRIAGADDIGDPRRLWHLLETDGITFWDSAPAMLGQMVPLLANQPPATDAMLRLVFLSGDWIPLPLPDQVRRVFPRAEVVSLGGATEATIWSNVYRIGAIGPHWRSVPYGRPIQNAVYYVLDARLEPCPVGVIGDLYIGGPVLADGYTDPALTANRFVPDPHAVRGGAIMYRTGDRASFWHDGTIEFFGRLDAQVNIQGHRVERGEIETILADHAGVAACVVLARADPNGDRRLVAWYVPHDNHDVSTADLRNHLASRLPDYMIPTAFMAIAAIPATENGKIDNERLPDPRASPAGAPTIATAPRDDAERRVAAIWRRVLGIDTVGAEDNFFDLGGHSSAIVRVQAALEDEMGQTISVVDLYRYSTVETLAAHLSGMRETRDRPDAESQRQKRLDMAQRNRERRGEGQRRS